MTTVDILVLGGGSALIVLIIWFFFGPKGKTAQAQAQGSQQKLTVVVEGGYLPDQLVVKKDLPVVLTFNRRDQGECTEWVIFKDLPIRENKEVKARLPEGKQTTLRFTPTKPGEYQFSCGMGMVHGKLIVKN